MDVPGDQPASDPLRLIDGDVQSDPPPMDDARSAKAGSTCPWWCACIVGKIGLIRMIGTDPHNRQRALPEDLWLAKRTRARSVDLHRCMNGILPVNQTWNSRFQIPGSKK